MSIRNSKDKIEKWIDGVFPSVCLGASLNRTAICEARKFSTELAFLRPVKRRKNTDEGMFE